MVEAPEPATAPDLTAPTGDLETADLSAVAAEPEATEYVGPYQFPDIKRRRLPGAMYLVTGLVLSGLYLATRNGEPVNVSKGFGC